MGESRAASGLDRLPWLADESALPRRRAARIPVVLIVAFALGLAAISYWLGMNNGSRFGDFDGSPAPRSTLALPDAREMQPETPPLSEANRGGTIPPMQRVDPAPQPIVKPVRKPPAVTPSRSAAPAPAKSRPAASTDGAAKPATPSYTKTPWPVRAVDGSSGRLVRIGTFSSRQQAKRGWRALMRNNPSLQRLPALVVAAPSARDGKTYYRLQMGTTSQAHSTILCQRMRMIGQSCVIVDAEGRGG